MYNEELLLKKVRDHVKEGDIQRLKALIDDIDELNGKHPHKCGEMYIDYDDIGNDSECDPYETFSILIRPVDTSVKYKPVIASEMSLNDLDYSLACLCGYFDEYEELEKPFEEEFDKFCDSNYEKVKSSMDDSHIVYSFGERILKERLDKFTKRPIDSQLYEINRLPKVVSMLRHDDISKYAHHWINDLALVHLVKYYHKKCLELESKLSDAEENLIVNSIINK